MWLVALLVTLPVFSTGAFASTESETTIGSVHGPLSVPNFLKSGCIYETPCKGYGWRWQL
ncbi:hypothetical protein FRB91_011491 [Serendipita sp. 411]|nr:hypothetical protein FRC15_011525 [Serendipita sp. 397]KAG8816455.1 hypothetical protein FRC19_000354 [Serendipita sp. 401]KAG8847721.1 hypothetical protein FRB91_011491 [Serendipita sp. 411]KAG8870200.1 hypothetical protein FRC20_000253 [Serendipita sp. 405]